jgi:hypothetical protein
MKVHAERADGHIYTELGGNDGDEEDNWAQDGADSAKNCSQVRADCPKNGTEGGARCS